MGRLLQDHRYDLDTDRCACGGEVVYFEADTPDDPEGEGCEVAGIPWGTQVDARCHKRFDGEDKEEHV